MAKNGGGEKKNGGGSQRPKSVVETITTLIMSGALGDEMKEKTKGALSGDSSFLGWWQRKEGESMVSTNNVLKALGLIGSYSIYRHVDPMEGSKIDDAAVLLAALGFGMLLVIPQSTELGAHFHDFETRVLIACHDVNEKDTDGKDKREEILKWMRNLTHKQEGRIAMMLTKIASDEKTKDAFKTILLDEKMRNTLRDLAGEETPSTNIEEAVEKVRKKFEEHWPQIKEKLTEADKKTAGALRSFRGFLNAKGVKR